MADLTLTKFNRNSTRMFSLQCKLCYTRKAQQSASYKVAVKYNMHTFSSFYYMVLYMYQTLLHFGIE